MICKIADNVITPLGFDAATNCHRLLKGESMLQRHEGWPSVAEPFTASLLDWDAANQAAKPHLAGQRYSRFERLCILSISLALAQTSIDAASPRVLFVISTTKGNVELLDPNVAQAYPESHVEPGITASRIARHFGNTVTPITVCNACISGLNAQIVAMRALASGLFDHAIVCGADVQSPFIVSGFMSFKALDPEPCKPFDCDRAGLNLGEAAATVIYSRLDTQAGDHWCAIAGALRNDANHISGPSRTGEGSYRALMAVTADVPADKLAVVNVHGTATLYNDEMESIALARAGLDKVPVNTYKGYYGHTMGAAGVLETLMTMHLLDQGIVAATRGYKQCGTSHQLNISPVTRHTDKRAFVKLLSGFGGCNAAMLFTKGGDL